MRTIIYSLRTNKEGRTELSIDLTAKIIFETYETLQIQLGDKVVTFKKAYWINTMRVYDNGDYQFIICSKSVSRGSALSKLIDYTATKMETMAEHFRTMKKVLQRELAL